MKRLVFAIIPVLLLFCTGCWDRKDIESRGYVLGIAIDKYPPIPQKAEENEPGEAGPKEEEILERMELHTGEPAYAMTIQLPLFNKLQSNQPGSGKGSGQGEGSNTWEITQIGNSFISMNREMRSRTNLELYYEHLQVIVISEAVAREGIEHILDFFVRDPEMRRRVKIFIAPGEAKSILDVKPRSEDYSSIYLALMPNNARVNSRMIHKTDLGEVIKFIHEGYDFVLPKVISTRDEVKASGGAVFRSGKMVGWLNELELEATKFIRKTYLGGVITVKIPKKKGLYVMEVTNVKTDIKPVIKGNIPSFNIEIRAEGNYAEEVNAHTHAKLNIEHLKSMEEALAKEIEKMCREIVIKAQKELKCDFLQLNRVLETRKPKVWKQVKDDWNTIFPQTEVKVKAKVRLNLVGVIE